MSRLARSSDHHPSVADHMDRYKSGGKSLTRDDSERMLALEELRDIGIIDDARYEAETAVIVRTRPRPAATRLAMRTETVLTGSHLDETFVSAKGAEVSVEIVRERD
jgi:hypothetical protein